MIDRDDWRTLGRGLVYGVILLGLAAVLGLAVRIFLLAAFGG